MSEPFLEHILHPVTVGDKAETRSYWLGYIDDIPFYISESLNWKEALLRRQELFGCGVRHSIKAAVDEARRTAPVKLWMAKDLDEYYGTHPCCMFRHEPALSESGKWWCYETDEPSGGRIPTMDLFDLKPGEKMQIFIQPNVGGEARCERRSMRRGFWRAGCYRSLRDRSRPPKKARLSPSLSTALLGHVSVSPVDSSRGAYR